MIEESERFLRIGDVIAKTGKSKASIYREMLVGAFPAAIKIGARAVAWRQSQIAEWMVSPIDYHSD
ncbi:AlpA family transcriptional regulator [Sphingobium sp. EM0848]|uniref:helix-turn-helix transcriptional regulator n=1 Tax=Sphingobium sp. EM0848 TaxID=2743473 RepID=UPI00159C7BB1|nr:AlpA family phage regulatory protein [Sphingobium sp. EM0848]